MKSLIEYIIESNNPDLSLAEILKMAYEDTANKSDIDKYDNVAKSLGGQKPKARAHNLVSGTSMKRVQNGKFSLIRFCIDKSPECYITICCKNQYITITKDDLNIDYPPMIGEQTYNAWIIDTNILQNEIDKANLPKKITL